MVNSLLGIKAERLVECQEAALQVGLARRMACLIAKHRDLATILKHHLEAELANLAFRAQVEERHRMTDDLGSVAVFHGNKLQLVADEACLAFIQNRFAEILHQLGKLGVRVNARFALV